MSDQDQPSYYAGTLDAVLQMFWGRGFLSPGGEKDVDHIVQGLDLKGKTVLDVGCGVGGPALTLARNHGAKVICIDVERSQIEETRKLFDEEGYGGSLLATHLKEPEGRIPVDSNSVDVVFGKDAWIHIKNKTYFFQECLRVLKPGGTLVASDWMKGENITKLYYEFEDAWAPLVFHAEPLSAYGESLKAAGFEKVKTEDVSYTYIDEAQHELDRIRSPEMKPALIKYIGEKGYAQYDHGQLYTALAFKAGEAVVGWFTGRKPSSKL